MYSVFVFQLNTFSDTQTHSVEFPWTRDRSDAEASIWQDVAFKGHRYRSSWRESNP